MQPTASKRLTKALCIIGIAVMAQTTLADVVIQDGPLPNLRATWGETVFDQWGTDYWGNPDNWVDETGSTSFEGNNGITHLYNPADQTLTLGNHANSDRVKHVSIRLLFSNLEGYSVPHGEPVVPAQWATIAATGGTITTTGAAWYFNDNNGFLIVQQSWSIDPQPGTETIDLSNIINNVVGGPGDLVNIRAETVCIPDPAALSLLALGGLVAARRRRA